MKFFLYYLKVLSFLTLLTYLSIYSVEISSNLRVSVEEEKSKYENLSELLAKLTISLESAETSSSSSSSGKIERSSLSHSSKKIETIDDKIQYQLFRAIEQSDLDKLFEFLEMYKQNGISLDIPCTLHYEEGFIDDKYSLQYGRFQTNPLNDTPLEWSLRNDHYEIFRLLITYGADINAVNGYGYTVLMSCIDWERSDHIVEILKYKMDLNLNYINNTGQTALDMALKSNNIEIIELLENVGALSASSLTK